MAIGGLGDRAEALDRPPRDAQAGTGAGHVRDREGELARTAREMLRRLLEVPEARQRVEQVVELLRVAEPLSLRRLRVDQLQARQRVGLGDRQVDVQERVPVAELGASLVAVMKADRDLRPEPRQPLPGGREPAPQPARDPGQKDIVDGHVARAGCADRLQLLERHRGEGELAGGADPTIEERLRGARPRARGEPPRQAVVPRAHDRIRPPPQTPRPHPAPARPRFRSRPTRPRGPRRGSARS